MDAFCIKSDLFIMFYSVVIRQYLIIFSIYLLLDECVVEEDNLISLRNQFMK